MKRFTILGNGKWEMVSAVKSHRTTESALGCPAIPRRKPLFPISYFLLPILLLLLSTCTSDWENAAADDAETLEKTTDIPLTIQEKLAEGLVTITKSQPVSFRPLSTGIMACCYARSAAAWDGDIGPFNAWGDNCPPSNAADQDTSTFWDSNYSNETHSVDWTDNRHWITLDLGEEKTFNTVVVVPRQRSDRCDLGEMEFYAGNDIKALGNTTDAALKLGSATFANDTSEKRATFENYVTARYVQVRGKVGTSSTEVGVAEIWVEDYIDQTFIEGYDGFNVDKFMEMLYEEYAQLAVIFKTLAPSDFNYLLVQNALTAAAEYIADFEEIEVPESLLEQEALQETVEAKITSIRASLTALIDKLSPPRTPPEW